MAYILKAYIILYSKMEYQSSLFLILFVKSSFRAGKILKLDLYCGFFPDIIDTTTGILKDYIEGEFPAKIVFIDYHACFIVSLKE